jgi:hypothetical protein
MAPSAPTTQNSALHNAANVASQQSTQQGLPQNTGDILANAGLNAQQLIELLRNIPSHLYNKVTMTSRLDLFFILPRLLECCGLGDVASPNDSILIVN